MVQLESPSTITETVKVSVNPNVDLICVLDYRQVRARGREILRNISFSITVLLMYPVLVFYLSCHRCTNCTLETPSLRAFCFLVSITVQCIEIHLSVSSLKHLFRYAMAAGELETNDE